MRAAVAEREAHSVPNHVPCTRHGHEPSTTTIPRPPAFGEYDNVSKIDRIPNLKRRN